MIQLYNYYRSTASFRVRIALNLKQLEYQAIPVNLLNHEQQLPEYKSINPQGLVPTLKIDNKIITQSLAIIEYLDDVYPNPPLLPHDAYQKAHVRAFALTIAAEIHPLNNLGVLQFLTQKMQLSEEQKNTWYQQWVAKGLTALENTLATQNHTDDFCFGTTPTLADICLIPQLYNARRFHCDISHYPTLIKIDANCQKHPAFVKACPVEVSKEREKTK